MADNEQGNSDSIYQAPQSETGYTSGDNLLEDYVGPNNSAYYLQKFARFEAGGGSATWHWPAFFLSSIWLLYRKMWMWAAIYWFGFPIGLQILTAVLAVTVGPELAGALYFVIYLVIAFGVMPVMANFLYYRHAKSKVEKVGAAFPPEQQGVELARIGGTSKVAMIIAVILFIVFMGGILAAISIPAYQDYTIRAQVSEGLALAGGPKAAVVEYYSDHNLAPSNNAEAGLPAPERLSGQYVESVSVFDGDIVITYGEDSHDVIYGMTLILTPGDVSDSVFDWECYSDDIAAKHLPAACR